MPLTRATLIRISTIDKCLQNHYRRWTINDLIDACTDALAEYEGRSNPVSRRTFQNDLAIMRSDRLGYNAPIVVRDNKYYEYEDPDYSITHFPLNDEGLDALNSALDILRQLQGFPQRASSIDTISKLNEQISRQTGSSVPAMLWIWSMWRVIREHNLSGQYMMPSESNRLSSLNISRSRRASRRH